MGLPQIPNGGRPPHTGFSFAGVHAGNPPEAVPRLVEERGESFLSLGSVNGSSSAWLKLSLRVEALCGEFGECLRLRFNQTDWI